MLNSQFSPISKACLIPRFEYLDFRPIPAGSGSGEFLAPKPNPQHEFQPTFFHVIVVVVVRIGVRISKVLEFGVELAKLLIRSAIDRRIAGSLGLKKDWGG